MGGNTISVDMASCVICCIIFFGLFAYSRYFLAFSTIHCCTTLCLIFSHIVLFYFTVIYCNLINLYKHYLFFEDLAISNSALIYDMHRRMITNEVVTVCHYKIHSGFDYGIIYKARFQMHLIAFYKILSKNSTERK